MNPCVRGPARSANPTQSHTQAGQLRCAYLLLAEAVNFDVDPVSDYTDASSKRS
jgi:hypothetical protein